MTDTTERIRPDTARHMAEIVASSGDAIVGQTPEGMVICWNGAAERLLGWAAEDVLGRSVALVVPAARLDAERDLLAHVRAGGRVEYARTERLRRDGTPIPVFVSFSPIRHADGGLAGVSTIMRDLRAPVAEVLPHPGYAPPDRRDTDASASTVLLVEDDLSLLDLLQETLTDAGHIVIVATDGRMALGLLELHPEVAAVVSDIVMPNGVSGVLLAREAQRLRPDLPVLLMSGHPPEEIGRLGSTSGYPFLVKPFRPDELTSQVRRLLN